VTSIRIPFLLLLALTVVGCASVGGGSVPGEAKVSIGNISNLPQVALPGASMQDARSVAMAAARTRGWDIVAADANQLLLERPLPPELPQAQALGSALAPPRMQVETNIAERGDGSIVALRAFVLTNPGTPEEKRLDYTSEYENQLLISLSSLSSAWIAARDKLRAEVPVLAEREGGGDTEADTGADLGDVAQTVSADGAAAADASTTAQEAPAATPRVAAAPTATRSAAPSSSAPPPAIRSTTTQSVTTGPVTTQPRSAQPATSAGAASGSALVAPTIEAPRSPTTAAEAAAPAPRTPAPVAPTVAADSGAPNAMLALNQGSRKGLWAYYAEDFARLRGCALGDRGAMLLQETNGFEIHEVQCVGSSNLLVKCRGGVCEPMR